MTSMKWLPALALATALVGGCGGEETQSTAPPAATTVSQPPPTPAEPASPPAAAPGGPTKVDEKKFKTTASGLKYAVIKSGTGKVATDGQPVKVHYTGWLKDGGKKFDSSVDRGEPFEFPLGQGRVIPGWDEGVKGMKVGEKRQLVIPAALGYGGNGTPDGSIPPNATLVFDVELLGSGG